MVLPSAHFDRDEVCNRLSLDIRVADHRSRVIESDGAANCGSGQRAQVLHSLSWLPEESVLSGDQSGTRISVNGLRIGASDDIAEIVDPEATTLVIALERSEISDRVASVPPLRHRPSLRSMHRLPPVWFS